MPDPQILIVEDDEKHGAMCARMLERRGYRTQATTSPKKALTVLDAHPDVDVVLADLQMPEMDGIQLLTAVKERRPQVDFIVMTGYGTVKTAVEAMQRGAAHYIQKPLDQDELFILLDRVFQKKRDDDQRRRLAEENVRLRNELQGRYRFESFIGQSPSMLKVIETMEAACGNRATVLITGESGTGKELVARGIHYNSFPADAPFIPVNCGALPKDLIESELFGYRKGSFTGASSDSEGLFCAASGGTIFLDEVMEMPPELQVKLMRVLQEHRIRRVGETKEVPVDVRVIAATNRPIQPALASGAIRSDLYYRLSVITIPLPPLRERRQDVPLLVDHFLAKHRKHYERSIDQVESAAMEAWMRYSWPGNVRELENQIEMLLAFGKTSTIRLADLPEHVRHASESSQPMVQEEQIVTLKESESRLIRTALARSQGNKSLAAQKLGISRKSLYKKIAEYRIRE